MTTHLYIEKGIFSSMVATQASLQQNLTLTHEIRIDVRQNIHQIKRLLKSTFEFAQDQDLRIELDENYDKLPSYSSDCVWSVRHEKDPLTDVKIMLNAMKVQTQENIGEELLIKISR